MRNIRMTGTLRGPFVILSRSSSIDSLSAVGSNLYCKSYIVRIKTDIDTPMNMTGCIYVIYSNVYT
ncbi:hypothetical protein T08_14103 [Trichinella sp. T8]|nr:hypothetical protein T08_14103 [Trichinella sp. T8]